MALTTNTTVSKPSYGGLLNPNPAVGNALSSLANKNPVTPTSPSLNQPNYTTSSGQAAYAPPPVSPTASNQPKTNGLLDVHSSLISNLPATGGTHTTTDTLGNTSTVKLPTPEPQNTISSTGTQPSSSQPSTQPITGNTTTPSGATVNATTGGLVNPPPGTNTFPGLIGSAVSSAQGNIPIGQNAADIASKYGEQIAKIGQGGANAESGYLSTGTTPVATGNAGLIARNVAAQQGALAQGESAALQGTSQQLSAQGAQTSGLQNAVNAVAPQSGASYFGNPLTGGLVGNGAGSSSNNLIGSAATGNNLVDTSLNNALQKIMNGSSTTDAMSNLVGGPVSTTAFEKAMLQYDPNWSPTSSNAIAAQNMAQGAQYQAQSQSISNALQTMTPVAQQLSSFMSSAGLDPAQAPLLNQQINTINKQTNPDAVNTMNAAIGELKSFATQLLSSQAGGTPTGVQDAVDSYDFSNFTPVELQTFMSNLNELGEIRLSQAQSAMKAGYGSSTTTTPAAGMGAQTSGGLDTGGMVPATNAANMLKIVGGAGANALSTALSDLGSQAGNAVAGAVGGAAESVTSGLAKTVGVI